MTTWMDRLIGTISPAWQLRRERTRVALSLLRRHYEGAATGRRTISWNKAAGDANALIGPALASLRAVARDLVRNNPYAESALSTIVDHTVGFGIVGKPAQPNPQALQAWKAWAETTACDADGRHDFYGLQKLVVRTVVESGEVLVRRRFRRIEDDLPLPLQLQVLDPDFLDTSKDTSTLPSGGGRIVQGVQFDGIGRRVGYWLFPEHPGSSSGAFGSSVLVPAESVQHIFKSTRPGQVRAPSWFAPSLLRFKEFDEFEDATLMKQKIAACLAVLVTDPSGLGEPLGSTDTSEDPQIDYLEPGMIKQLLAGQSVEVVDPPQAADYDPYSRNVLRAIATGLGVTYEDLTGDYTNLPFSAARMSRLRHEARVHDWRWRMLIPQFCDPVWTWAMQVAVITGKVRTAVPPAEWTAPPLPLIDPVNEGLAYQRLIRSGLITLSEALRERGYDPRAVLEEMAKDNQLLDELKLILDSDPRKMTQAGQSQAALGGSNQASDAGAAERALWQAIQGGRR